MTLRANGQLNVFLVMNVRIRIHRRKYTNLEMENIDGVKRRQKPLLGQKAPPNYVACLGRGATGLSISSKVFNTTKKVLKPTRLMKKSIQKWMKDE